MAPSWWSMTGRSSRSDTGHSFGDGDGLRGRVVVEAGGSTHDRTVAPAEAEDRQEEAGEPDLRAHDEAGDGRDDDTDAGGGVEGTEPARLPEQERADGGQD